jgi:predicted N-acyltransferase
MGRLFSSDSSLMLRIESLFKMLVHIGNGKKGIRILIAGNSQVSGPLGLFFRPEVDHITQAECWKQVLENAEQQWGPFAIILAKEFGNDQQALTIKKMKAAGFKSVSSLPVMMMQIEPAWNSFEDYLLAMSAKYRIRAKAARKKAAKVNTSNWGVTEIKEHLSQIEKLYLNVYSRARFRLMRIDPVYFLNLKQNLGDRFRFEAYHANGQLIGFRTSIDNGKSLDAHLIGLDYEANKEHSLYINMLYDYVEHAIENNFSSIDFGRTAMEIKSTVGAVPVDFTPLVKIRNPLLNGLTCVLMENTASVSWVQRHPFKD